MALMLIAVRSRHRSEGVWLRAWLIPIRWRRVWILSG